MSLKFLKTLAVATTIAASTTASFAADWAPSGPIKMMIAFRAGGGVDARRRAGWSGCCRASVQGMGRAHASTAGRPSGFPSGAVLGREACIVLQHALGPCVRTS